MNALIVFLLEGNAKLIEWEIFIVLGQKEGATVSYSFLQNGLFSILSLAFY